jgi:hypothetical protein
MQDNISTWDQLAENWPDVIYLKDADSRKLPNFPYRQKYFRNLCTGNDADLFLKKSLLSVGRFRAIRKKALVMWLDHRTKN